MNKLNIFSQKLGKLVEVSFDQRAIPVTPDGGCVGEGIVMAWNNSADSWVDNGWNNSADSWVDSGWNNSADSWVDNGWNNSSDSWQDSGWSNSSDSWGDAGGSSGGCFITTACVERQGLDDDCRELQILRKYRDELVRKDEDFRGKVLEYYRKAPLIIQEIEKTGESGKVYDKLYQEMIQPCVIYLENGKTEEAKQHYLDCYEQLVSAYLVS